MAHIQSGHGINTCTVMENISIIQRPDFATVWWNNQLMRKLRTSGCRMVGLNEFYKLQFVTLALRTAVFWVLRHESLFELDQVTMQAGHAFMLLFILLVVTTISSFPLSGDIR